MAPRGPTPDKARLGLPDRWLHCPKTGTVVNNLFLPFKTPLCKMYDTQIAEKRLQFHPEDVFKSAQMQGRRIGLWIDLTNTDRYYFSDQVTENSCVYKKMPMAGRGISPTKEETEKFIEIVQQFHAENPDLLVGIHCTHGFNRTGFLIAVYLFQEEGYGLDAAISEFSSCRQGGIYKQDYYDDLYDRYDPSETDRLIAPEKPDWERSDGNGVGGHFFENGGSDSSQNAVSTNGNSHQNGSRQENKGVSGAKLFMDGLVDGVTWCQDAGKKSMLQAKIQELCKYNKQGFPGLQPVSLSRDNIRLFEEESYMVSWKADGMRYMVYINDGDVYAFDRDNEVFEIPNLDFIGNDGSPLDGTLVDTEVIIDEVNGVKHPRMLIYDIMRHKGVNIMKEPFHLRFDIIQREIIDKRKAAFKSGRLNQDRQIMSVRRKDFYDLSATYKLFSNDFKQGVKHEIDGLIFQPKYRPYETGRCDRVLKWKPPSHNSVDFLLKIERRCQEGMLPEWIGALYVQNSRERFGEMKATTALKKYDNKIIECTLKVNERGQAMGWEFMRERTDKSLPNGLRTAQNVFATMMHPVTEEYLLEHINRAIARKRQLAQQQQQQQNAKRQRV